MDSGKQRQGEAYCERTRIGACKGTMHYKYKVNFNSIEREREEGLQKRRERGARPGKTTIQILTSHFITANYNVVATLQYNCRGGKKKSLSCTQQSQFRHTLHNTSRHTQREQTKKKRKERL